MRHFFDRARSALLAAAAAAAVSVAILSYGYYTSSSQIASVAILQAGNFGAFSKIDLEGYYTIGDAGGGAFVQIAPTTANGGTVINDGASHSFQRVVSAGQPYNVAWFGAKCNGIQVTDGVSTTGGSATTISSASAKWANVVPGEQVVVNGAATSARQLVTTVASLTSSSAIVMNAGASTAGTGETVSVYSDDTTAINNTITAANAANAAVTLPNGAICGLANPGAAVQKNFYNPGLYLNGGTIWMGQTGPVSNTGAQLVFYEPNAGIKGPGTIDCLYQTNQGISQTADDCVIFEASGSPVTVLANNYISGNVLIQNTKGRCFSTFSTNGLIISDLTVQNCGDSAYQNSSTPGDMTGRSMGGQIESPIGSTIINNYRALNIAQSGILVDGFITPSATSQVIINNFYCYNAGYFCGDFESLQGSVTINNSVIYGSGVSPSGVLIDGGNIFRDVAYLTVSNTRTTNIDGNAESFEMSGADYDWKLSNISCSGTSAHACSVYLDVGGNVGSGVQQRLSIKDMTYDSLTSYFNSGAACSSTNPFQVSLQFSGLKASHQYTGTYATTFGPQGNSSTFFYILGSDSDLGTVAIDSLGSSTSAVLYDFFRVLIQGSIAFTGATGSASYGSTTWSQPLTSFTCP